MCVYFMVLMILRYIFMPWSNCYICKYVNTWHDMQKLKSSCSRCLTPLVCCLSETSYVLSMFHFLLWISVYLRAWEIWSFEKTHSQIRSDPKDYMILFPESEKTVLFVSTCYHVSHLRGVFGSFLEFLWLDVVKYDLEELCTFLVISSSQVILCFYTHLYLMQYQQTFYGRNFRF